MVDSIFNTLIPFLAAIALPSLTGITKYEEYEKVYKV